MSFVVVRFNQIRNAILFILLLVVQYQILGGTQGIQMRDQLQDELLSLQSQQKALIAANKRLGHIQQNTHSEELKQELLRSVYHMVAPDERFEKI